MAVICLRMANGLRDGQSHCVEMTAMAFLMACFYLYLNVHFYLLSLMA